MSVLPAPLAPIRPAFLTRTTPAARLVAGTAWLVASIVTLNPIVPVRLSLAAIIALWLWSGLPLRRIPLRLAPLGFAILSLTVFSILLSSTNGDHSLAAIAQIGPARITGPAISAGVAVGLRIVVIALTTLLVFGPSDLTRMADSAGPAVARAGSVRLRHAGRPARRAVHGRRLGHDRGRSSPPRPRAPRSRQRAFARRASACW